MIINFTKMEGLGNDYIYINCINEEYEELYKKIPGMCDRHFGIGADGVILIEKSQIADFKMRIFNSDGGEAKMCGNGIRCVGKYLYDKRITKKKNLSIETLSGIKILKLEENGGLVSKVEVDMGEPEFKAEKIPAIKSNFTMNMKGIDIDFKCVSIGNPHAVSIVENLKELDLEEYGPIVENDCNFPEKTNVEFVQILDKNNIKMRVWERGSKETLACGTGACASAVICNLKGYTENVVNVYLLGGVLNIYWNERNNHIYMTGPARTVFEGKIEI